MMMASTRFSPKLGSVSLKLWSLCKPGTRLVHSSRITYKKQYDYDLNDLLAWMKETKLVFGSPRKPTKTGKLKKTTKNLGSQSEEYLEMLVALSASQSNIESSSDISLTPRENNIRKKRISHTVNSDICDEVLSSQLPVQDDVPLYTKTAQPESFENPDPSPDSAYFDIPDEVMNSIELSSDVAPVDDSVSGFADAIKESKYDTYQYHSEYTEDGIHIPKIPPVPALNSQSNHKRHKSSLSEKDPESTYGEAKNLHRKFPLAEKNANLNASISGDETLSPRISVAGNAKSLKAPNHKGKTVRESTSSGRKEKRNISSDMQFDSSTRNESKKGTLTEDDISIPKIAPIPSVNMSSSQSPSASHLSSPSSSSLSSALPIEAPESFDIITKIPLFPKETSDQNGNVDPNRLAAFRLDVEQMSLRVLPSVKTIINKTMSDLNRYFLNRWRDGLINELGEEGFKQHQEANIKRGVNLHANIMEYLSGKPVCELQIMPDNEGHWSSLQPALAKVSDIRALEAEIYHSMLMYRGVFDCVARYKDLLCIIDWKTSKKPRPLLKNTYDDPIQVAAYIGALNASEGYVEKYGQVNHGMIVVAYPDGSPAHIHVMNRSLCEQYWQDWTDRLYNFYQLTYTEKIGTKKIGDANSSGARTAVKSL